MIINVEPLSGTQGVQIKDVTFGLPPNTFQKKCLVLSLNISSATPLEAGSVVVLLSLYRKTTPPTLVKTGGSAVDYPAGTQILSHQPSESLDDGKLLINLSDVPMTDVHVPEVYRLFVEAGDAAPVCIEFKRINSGVEGGPSTIIVPNEKPPVSIPPPPLQAANEIRDLGEFNWVLRK